jgi:aminomethyltransferase
VIRTTPFHERQRELNQTGLWKHWAGHLVPQKYQLAEKAEYFAVRNAAGVFDTSALYKYRITGRDAERFLSGVLTRDVRTCRPGRAQYTLWCDGDGWVLEDGVVFRHSADEFWLTAAEPNLGYLADLVGWLDVAIEDISERFGALAVQGPASRTVVSALAPEAESLPFFGLTEAKVGGVPVTISRTGYTGDLGYEIWVDADDALAVWDAVLAAGEGRGVIPIGQVALLMTRIEAGLLLLGVDFTSARFAWSDADRSTPMELGLDWMLRGIDDDGRPFVGRQALRRRLATSGDERWRTVGIVIDWQALDRMFRTAGRVTPKDHVPVPYESMIYDDDRERVGYTASMMYSPILQRHVAIARVRPDLSPIGTQVNVEVTLDHAYEMVAAHVTGLPFYDPPRKTAP